MIDLTPLEVRKKKGDFRRIMRGYDPALVDDFLDLVADRLEQLVRENMALAERAGRQDQEVAEYRERERALTEALVTAQEMREEIRKQSAREAELAKRTAEQEASQLRGSVDQEVRDLRAKAEQEVRELRAKAEQEARDLRSTAQQESRELRTAAQREASQLRSKVMLEREREEEAFRRLRGRQEQFLTSYRAFLERELAELSSLTRVLGLPATRGGTAAETGSIDGLTLGAVGPGAAAAAFMSAQADVPVFSEPGSMAEDLAAMAEDLDDFASPGDDPEPIDLKFAQPAVGGDDVGLTDLSEEVEPFAPEPFEPEPPRPTATAARPAPEVELAGLEAEDWSVADMQAATADPMLIDIDLALSAESAPAPFPGESAADLDDAEEDAAELLRNAEAAGYLGGTDETADPELVLDDELARAETGENDDGWLPSMLDDEE